MSITITGCFSETIQMSRAHLPCEHAMEKILPIMPLTLCSCHYSIREVFSFPTPWFWPMKTWATRMGREVSVMVSACSLGITLLWGGLGEDPWRRNAGPQCDWWTHTEYFSPAILLSSYKLHAAPTGLHLMLTHKARGLICVTSTQMCPVVNSRNMVYYPPAFSWYRYNSE